VGSEHRTERSPGARERDQHLAHAPDQLSAGSSSIPDETGTDAPDAPDAPDALRPRGGAVARRHWPLLDLAVRTPRVELRYPTEDLLLELAELATGPIHPPETMPFTAAWSDAPPEVRARGLLQFHWRQRAGWDAAAWHLPLVTMVDGEVVGTQALLADAFAALLTVSSGSWLGMAHHGRGLGTEMRAAVLHLAFAGLGAERAESAAFDDNPASLGVSRSLGYVDNGDQLHARRGQAGRVVRLLLTREAWEARRRDDIEIEGLEACLELFGLAPAPERTPAPAR